MASTHVAFGGFPSVTTISDDVVGIPSVERLWSYITRNALWKTCQKPNDRRVVVIQLDTMALFEDDPELGRFVVQDFGNGVSSRVIPRQEVPFPLKTTEEVWKTWTATSAKRPVHFCGVISGVSRVRNGVYCRQLRCSYCGATHCRIEPDFEEAVDETCCLEGRLRPQYEEHQPSRVTLPVQTLSLSPLCGNGGANPPLRRVERVEMTVYDELTSQFRLGDLVEAFGLVQHLPKPKAKQQSTQFGHPLQLKVEGRNVCRLGNPWELLGPLVPRKGCLEGTGDLESVCRIMQKAIPHLHPPSFLLASLLSSVMVGRSVTGNSRDQIHILLTSHGHDPAANQMLLDTAALLSPIHGLQHYAKSGSVCEVVSSTKASGVDAVSAHALALSRGGITVLDLDQLTKAEKKRCVEYLQSSVCAPCAGAEFTFPVTSTLWATAQSQSGSISASGLVEVLGEALCDTFDLVIPFSVQHDPLYDQFTLNHLFRGDVGEDSAAESAQKRLQSLIRCAMECPEPHLSRDAQELLQHYYTYVRNPRAFGEPIQQRSVPIHVFHSLIRFSKASARLTLSPVVRAVPDVTLAIKLMEETLLETGVMAQPSRLMVNMEGISHQCSYPSLDAELQAIYRMLQKALCRGMAAEE